ncbi:MAG: isochorismatase family protein [Blastocatellia bacterium]
MTPNSKLLDPRNSALIVIDAQEAFRGAIGDFALIALRIATAVRGFRILNIPIIVTEQYPKGLGRTAEEIIYSLSDDFEAIEKSEFSARQSPLFVERIKSLGTRQIVLCGVETHVCVSQTAHDLLEEGFEVHLMTDCVGSRFDYDKQAGLSKMFASSVIPSSVEMALFELMRDSKHPNFKEIQALVK